ncbi:unnamed protein product [Adineta ricciae]|uniref:RBR-type E3 ubiquitin transferase n=1 Tax=Adineta ricciae TaxID=249248 RepID=A0A814AAC2_ADIRI|nr:unnamed protein product [Adineta ricciae]CAF0971799.1 unnamed protein product [Adineta ricciae]
MPQFDFADKVYTDSKTLRSCTTSKTLRRLRAFEHHNYKRTFEVQKIGHNITDAHELNDGGLPSTRANLTFSLNKKKRWLLPDILEQRILQCKSDEKAYDPTIDERLKIVMYENENVDHDSTCIRYANSQAEPQILYKKGRRFNSKTLTKWMDFQTRERWGRRRRRARDSDQVNHPNFGFTQRPGFFPSEVTYHFLYPRRSAPSSTFRTRKSALLYKEVPDDVHDVGGRSQLYELDSYLDEEEIDYEEVITMTSNDLDENEKWSIVFDNQYAEVNEFPLESFISASRKSPRLPHSREAFVKTINDTKAHKYYEPTATPSPVKENTSVTNETSLCSIPCSDESDFLNQMKQSAMNLSQANLSPAVFLQRTSSATFCAVYTYCREISKVNVTIKYPSVCPKIVFDAKSVTLTQLVQIISDKFDESVKEPELSSILQKSRISVNDLRGSLPVPPNVMRKMLLVQPNALNKQTVLQNEHISAKQNDSTGQFFDTTHHEYEMLECSICYDVLTTNDAYRLLPCNHTLCQICLSTYIRTTVASATYSSSSISPITCFQPNCPTQLNSALLQVYLSFEIYQLYTDALVDRQLFSLGKYRKCPSRSCSNLLIVDENNNQSSMCSCGQRVCVKCLEEYHFPATCRQYKTYVECLRKSGDDILSLSKVGDNPDCYIAEGKNCPNCGEFVEKNGGCPHMTCKCGNEYCWNCLKPWHSHNYATCFVVGESVHELRSSTRNRLHNKAVNHRRRRNQYAFDQLTSAICHSKPCSPYHDILLATYIDLNTLAEYIYVVLQRRRLNVFIRAVLGQTAKRLALDASQIKIQVECGKIKIEYINQMRERLQGTLASLAHMRKTKVLF